MEISLSRPEITDAIEIYLLLKGYKVVSNTKISYTSNLRKDTLTAIMEVNELSSRVDAKNSKMLYLMEN